MPSTIARPPRSYVWEDCEILSKGREGRRKSPEQNKRKDNIQNFLGQFLVLRTSVGRTAGKQSQIGNEASERSAWIVRNKKVQVVACRLTHAAAVALAAKRNASTRYNNIGSLPINMNICALVNKNGCGTYIDVIKPNKKSRQKAIRMPPSLYRLNDAPKPKMPVPMIGIIQWIRACADHPYQLRKTAVSWGRGGTE